MGTHCEGTGEDGGQADRTSTLLLASAPSFPLMTFWLREVGKNFISQNACADPLTPFNPLFGLHSLCDFELGLLPPFQI